MSVTGFGSLLAVRRKRTAVAVSFLMYLDGIKSAAQAWVDRADTPITVTNGTTSGSESDDAELAPYGYRCSGADLLGGNIGLTSAGIDEFTIAAVVSRDDLTNNDAVFYGLFGTTHYPRMYFWTDAGVKKLTCEVKLAGNVKTLTVSNVDTFIVAGQPAFIVFRGKETTGMEVLINNVVRATNSDTGANFDSNTSAFLLAKDSNLSYFLTGTLRGLFVCSQYLTNQNLTDFYNMLVYEGYFSPLRDTLKKWSGTGTPASGSTTAVGTSPWVCARNANCTATAGFETKVRRPALYVKITAATGAASAFASLGLNAGSQTLSAAIAKKLPGVTAGNTVTAYAELYSSSISDGRVATIEIEFFSDDGTKRGSTTTITATEAAIWQQKKSVITVPALATRVNMTLKASCANGETLDVWLANPKIV